MRVRLGLAILGLALVGALTGCSSGASSGEGQTKEDFTPKGGVPDGFKNSAPKGPSTGATPPAATGNGG